MSYQQVTKRNVEGRDKREKKKKTEIKITKAYVGTEKKKKIGKQKDGQTDCSTGQAKKQRGRFTGLVNGQHANQACAP